MRLIRHFLVLVMLAVFAPAHLLLSLVAVFSRRVLPLGATRVRRWKSMLIHGDLSFRWSWWSPAQEESGCSVLRLLFLLEIGDLLNRVRRVAGGEKRLVALQIAHIGDLIISVKPLRRLHQAWQSRMSVVVGPWNRALATELLPGLEIREYAPGWRVVNRAGRGLGFWEELVLLLRWRRKGADTLVNFGPAWPFVLVIAVFLRPRLFVSQHRDWYSMYDVADEMHVLQRGGNAYAMADEAAGAAGADTSMDEAFLVRRTIEAKSLPGLPASARYFCVGVGAGWEGKAWPAERFAEVLTQVCSQQNLHVVFLGSEKDHELASAASVGLNRTIMHNLCGHTSLPEVISILSGAVAFFGNDSGLLHMAALAGLPTLALFLPGAGAAWNPPGDDHIAIEAPGSCPCAVYQMGACRQPADHCMSRIPEEAVLNALSSLLAADNGARENLKLGNGLE